MALTAFEQVISRENLELGLRKAARGKRSRREVAEFCLRQESELFDLEHALQDQQWCPSSYRHFCIYERKPRVISVAPFRDRVVHHALMNVLEPVLDDAMIPNSFACRRNKGVHKAVSCFQRLAHKYAYSLKLDIRQYFPSIDHHILKTQLRSYTSDTRLLHLCDLIIDSTEHPQANRCYFPGDDLFEPFVRKIGIPIGNLTSQVFANVYLNGIDQWLARLDVGYLRYVDDLTLLANDKSLLWEIRGQIESRLTALRLRLHENKVQLTPTRCKIDLLGYQVSRKRRWLRNDNGYRARRRLRKLAVSYGKGDVDLPAVRDSVQAWIGHAQHAQTRSLRTAILGSVCFQRASVRN